MHRFRLAHNARESLATADPGHHTELNLEAPELGALGCYDEVAGSP